MTPCGKPTPRGSCPLPADHSGRCLDLPAQAACTFPGCANRSRRSSGGLCRGHDAQRLRHQPLTPIIPLAPGTVPIGVRVTEKTATMLDELGPTRGRAAKKVLERWANEREGG